MTIPVYIGKTENYTLHHLVRSVKPDSNAEMAGLKQMDLITHINGEIVQVTIFLTLYLLYQLAFCLEDYAKF